MGCIGAPGLTFWLQTKQPLRDSPEAEMRMLAAGNPQEPREASRDEAGMLCITCQISAQAREPRSRLPLECTLHQLDMKALGNIKTASLGN